MKEIVTATHFERMLLAECVGSVQADLWQLISGGKPSVLSQAVELRLDDQIAAARAHAGGATRN
jgi:hypothetical protein